MAHKSNIVMSHESSGSIAFVIACDDREKATDRNILLAVNTFYLNLFDSVESEMEYMSGNHTRVIVTTPIDRFKLRWTFTETVNI